MSSSDEADVKIAGQIDFNGVAVELDMSVRDKNDGLKSQEATWLERASLHDADTSKSEVEFFKELRDRLQT